MAVIRTYNNNFKSILESNSKNDNLNELKSFSKNFRTKYVVKKSIFKKYDLTTILKKKNG